MKYEWSKKVIRHNSDGTPLLSATQRDIHDDNGKHIGHAVPYRYGRGWDAYHVSGAKRKVLNTKADVEAFFADCELATESDPDIQALAEGCPE